MEKREYPALGETLWQTTLPNGLPVLVIPRAGFSRKLAYFVTDYGAVHRRFTLNGKDWDTPAGVAHFLEHKMFDMPDGRDVMQEFARLGASPNAFTSYDLTAYYFSCTEYFDSCLQLLLEFVSTAFFTEETVAKEQGIIGQEIDMHADNPDSRIFEELAKSIFHRHPITVPILGDRSSIGQLTPEILHACHQAFYRPGNMLLCVIGDVDPEAVAETARRILPATDTAVVTRQQSWAEDMTCPRSFHSLEMEVAMPMFQLGFKCEPIENDEAAVRAETVGELAAEALMGESSALYLRLYEEGIIDASFGGGFDTMDDMAMLCASGDSRDPEAVRDAILEEAQRLCREGIDEADFLRMKRSAMGRRIRDLDGFSSTVFRVCAYRLSGFDYFDFPRIYRDIQKEDIYEFLQRVVRPERSSLCVIYPKEDTKP